jgi:hypothetical protein
MIITPPINTLKKPSNIHMIKVRIPLDQLNKLERRAIDDNTDLSKVVRKIFDKLN